MKIVIFDTGTGGELFTQYYQRFNPKAEVLTVIDKDNSPYGGKNEDEIFELTDRAIRKHVGKVDIIVLACNTATAVAIDKLRSKYPKQVFIGFEPMLKTAAKLTETGKVMVLATNATKNAKRYKDLKSRFSEVCVVEPRCDSWAVLIDNGAFTQKDANNALGKLLDGVDVIILACTHYVKVSDGIQQIVGSNITIINPFNAVSKYIDKVVLNTTHSAQG